MGKIIAILALFCSSKVLTTENNDFYGKSCRVQCLLSSKERHIITNVRNISFNHVPSKSTTGFSRQCSKFTSWGPAGLWLKSCAENIINCSWLQLGTTTTKKTLLCQNSDKICTHSQYNGNLPCLPVNCVIR